MFFFFFAINSDTRELGPRKCRYFPCCGIQDAWRLLLVQVSGLFSFLFHCFDSENGISSLAQTAALFTKSAEMKENDWSATQTQK
jgi:hypothetical protein